MGLQNWIKKDKTFSFWVKIKKGKVINKVKIGDLENMIKGCILSNNVPEKVKIVFEGSKKLFIYGYFQYYFFTISNHYAFLAIESALKNKYSALFGTPKKYFNLTKIIEELVKAKIILKSEGDYYNLVIRRLRNSYSHLENPIINAPDREILVHASELINKLYN